MADPFPNSLAGRHLAWYFHTRAAGQASAEEIDAHFAPEYRWDWGSPRDADALELWFTRWRNMHATILKVEELTPTRFVVTSRVGEGGAATVWFDMEDVPPHRIRRTSTSEAKHATEAGDVARDTAVERVDDTHSRAVLHPAFTTPNGPFGGYVAAVAVRAAGAHARLPVPRSFTCHFVGVGRSGAVDIEVQTLRSGRRLESLRIEMTQQQKVLLSGLLWAGDESAPVDGSPSAAPDRSTHREAEVGEVVPLFGGALDCRFDETTGARAAASTRLGGERRGARGDGSTDGDRCLAAARLLLPFDLLAVQAVSRLPDGNGRQPQTLDTNITFFNPRVATDWVHCEARAEAGDDDVALATATLTSATGELVAVASQQVLRRLLWGTPEAERADR